MPEPMHIERRCSCHGLAKVKTGNSWACPVQVKERRVRRREQGQKSFAAWLSAQKVSPCTDCGESHPSCVMDFHHRDPSAKLFGISSRAWHKSEEKLQEEIDKCDLLCANCHRRRTNGISPVGYTLKEAVSC